jgi:hypothetical protein
VAGTCYVFLEMWIEHLTISSCKERLSVFYECSFASGNRAGWHSGNALESTLEDTRVS